MVQETKVDAMSRSAPSLTALRVAELSQHAATPFELRPDSTQMKAITAELELLGLRKLSFAGTIMAEGKSDWRLEGMLGATVVQPCAVTLDPVTTRIDVKVTRHFIDGLHQVDAPEAEMPEDDTIEALTPWIDPADIMKEALVLALPLYPRAQGAALGEAVFAAPGVLPMRDEDARPFAGLAGLRASLEDPSKE